MRNLLLAIAIVIAAAFPHLTNAQGCDGAGNCYVRSAASGAGTGVDWTNAYTGFGTGAGQANPATMTRGVTYYVAGGNYNLTSVTTFISPNSGTTLITVLAPTIASHGTNTGWSNAYQAQAVFGPFIVASGYWTFNGVYRGSGTGNPAIDWRTGYGFKMMNSNGAGAPAVPGNTPGIHVGDISGHQADHVTIEYFEMQGAGDTTCTYPDSNGFNFAQSPTFMFNWVHDTGGAALGMDALDTDIIMYNWVQNTQSCPEPPTDSGHSEGFAIRGSANLTFAYNYLENIEGTAYIGTPCPSESCWTASQPTWTFYGNVFFSNPSEWKGNCASGCTRNGAGNVSPQNGLSTAIMQFFSDSADIQIFTAMNWYNNTFYQLPGDATTNGPSVCQIVNASSSFSEVKTFTFENNIGGNCTELTMPNLGVPPSVGTGTLVQDHNTYCNVGHTGDTGTGLQNLASCAGLWNSPSTNDFRLATDTSAWTSLSSPFNVDLLGNTRTTSRGAFQLTSGGTVTLTPTTYTFATVLAGHTSSDSPKTLTLTNTMSSSITVTSVTLSNNTDFQLTSNTCGTVTNGSPCIGTTVSFFPALLDVGLLTSTLTVNYNISGGGSGSVTASLSGTSTTPAVTAPCTACQLSQIRIGTRISSGGAL